MRLVAKLRDRGVASEIYPEAAKMKKQMEYANRRMIPFVVIIGGNELAEQKATIKNMKSGEQTTLPFSEVSEFFA